MPFYHLKCYMDAVMSDEFIARYDQRDTYVLKSNQAHNIPADPPYRVELAEKPYETSGLSITNYTEVDALPGSAGEFFVDYEHGYIYFHTDDAERGVLVTYYGMGSIIRACDINQFVTFLNSIRPLMSALEVIALSPANRMVKIRAGTINIHSNYIATLNTKLMDFGPGGAYQLDAITANYYAKIIVAVNYEEIAPMSSTIQAWFSVYQGDSVPTVGEAELPDVAIEAIPIAVILVHDDGSGTGGTILDISSGDITDCRPLFTGGVWDHGTALGLSDDDHPQYLKKAGDTITGNITVSSEVTIDGRDLSEDGDILDDIDTSEKILDKIKAIDGSGSGLDADSVDGLHKADIEDLAGADKIITFYHEGNCIESETWLNGFHFGGTIEIKRVSVFARSQPTNSALKIAVLRAVSQVITVTIGAGQYMGDTILGSAIQFTDSQALGLNTVDIGDGDPGGELNVAIFYSPVI